MKICINNKKLKFALIVFILFRVLEFKLNENFGLYIMFFGINQWVINLLIDILIIIIINRLILNYTTKKNNQIYRKFFSSNIYTIPFIYKLNGK